MHTRWPLSGEPPTRRPGGSRAAGLQGPPPRPRRLPGSGPEPRPEPRGLRPPPARRAGGALRRPSALRRSAHPLARASAANSFLEPVYLLRAAADTCEGRPVPAAPSRGPPRPGPSGEALCALVGGRQGAGSGGWSLGKTWGLGPGSAARVGRGDWGGEWGAVGSGNRLWLTPYDPRRGDYRGQFRGSYRSFS